MRQVQGAEEDLGRVLGDLSPQEVHEDHGQQVLQWCVRARLFSETRGRLLGALWFKGMAAGKHETLCMQDTPFQGCCRTAEYCCHGVQR